MSTQTKINPADLIPVCMVGDEYPHLFSQKQFNWLLRHRERNGLSRAIVKMGERRLFLSKSRFSEWLANQSEAA